MMTRRSRHLAAVCGLGPLLLGCGNGDSDTTSSSTSGASSMDSAAEVSTSPPTTAPPTTEGSMTTDGSGGSSSTTGAEPAVRRVFVTAAAFTGDLAQLGGGGDGPGGADKLCSEAATTAGLDGSWVAWVSTSRVDALTRLPPDITWTLVDGATLVFTGRAAIQFGPEHAIDRTEAGDVLPSGTTVWTNTDAFGRNATAGQSDACADWTAQTGVAAVGVLIDASLDGTMGLSWTDTGLPQGCGGAHHLYCFQQ